MVSPRESRVGNHSNALSGDIRVCAECLRWGDKRRLVAGAGPYRPPSGGRKKMGECLHPLPRAHGARLYNHVLLLLHRDGSDIR